MSKIQEVDRNFAVYAGFGREGLRAYDVTQLPFSVHGLRLPDGEMNGFHRLPPAVADKINPGVQFLNHHTSGGRLRFATDSPYIGIDVQLNSWCDMLQMAATGVGGFDLYVTENEKERYLLTFQPARDEQGHFIGATGRPGKMQEYTLYFPLYSGVTSLQVVLDEQAAVQAASPYRHSLPVVYYGSSITQRGCATRPGNAYPSIIARRLNRDFLNLGFSGNAFGEEAVGAYIASLDMAAFVLDYDHNAANADHLRATHAPLYRAVRAAHPELPILCVTRPDYDRDEKEGEERRLVVWETVEQARAAGDTRVWFVDGREFSAGDVADSFSCDGCHPNDLGFFCMARVIGAMLTRVL